MRKLKRKRVNWENLEWEKLEPCYGDDLVDDCVLFSIEEIDGDQINVTKDDSGGVQISIDQAKKKNKKDNLASKSHVKTSDPSIGEEGMCEISESTEIKGLKCDEEQFLTPSQHETLISQEANSTWGTLSLRSSIVSNLLSNKFQEPTSVQTSVIPQLLEGKDVIASSQTGSGKTLAYSLPLLHQFILHRSSLMLRLSSGSNKTHCPWALVVAPTRELAQQVVRHIRQVTPISGETSSSLSKTQPLPVMGCEELVGGMSRHKQRRLLLSRRPAVVVGTPGRLLQLLQREGEEESGEKVLDLSQLSHLVLDEADRMVEEGHYSELVEVLEMSQKGNPQIALLSATMFTSVSSSSSSVQPSGSPDFNHLLSMLKFRQSPSVLNLSQDSKLEEREGGCQQEEMFGQSSGSSVALPSTLRLSQVFSQQQEKDAHLLSLLSSLPLPALVFSNAVLIARRLQTIIEESGVLSSGMGRGRVPTEVRCLHGQKQQRQRFRALDSLREGRVGVLVSTDVAARGLDVPGIKTIIHYDIPSSSRTFVHRSGRTARAGQEGMSVSIVSPTDLSRHEAICKNLSLKGEQMPLEDIGRDKLDGMKERASVASKIASELMKKTRRTQNDAWIRKLAYDMDQGEIDLLVDSDEVISGENGDRVKKLRGKMKSILSVGISDRKHPASRVQRNSLKLKRGRSHKSKRSFKRRRK